MTQDRWNELMYGDGKLTEEEIAYGWHFCEELDDCLVDRDGCPLSIVLGNKYVPDNELLF